jgi:small subunit ribosomal protein S16
VAVKIRLKRMGKIRQPYYRVVVVDSRKKRDGRVIEEIGKYHPKEEPSFIEVVSDRAQYWLGVGAQPSEAVAALLKVTGDWQKFKGLPGTEGTLRTKEAKRDKQELFNEALKDAANEPKGTAVTKKKAAKKMAQSETPDEGADKPADKAAEKPAEKAAEAKPEAPAAEEAPAEATPADESPVTADDVDVNVAEAEKSGDAETGAEKTDAEKTDAEKADAEKTGAEKTGA